MDSLITDWVVKKEIVHSANIINNLIDKVTRIIAMIKSDIQKTRRYIKKEEIDQRIIIVGK